MNEITRTEKIQDAILFVTICIPVLLWALLLPFCDGPHARLEQHCSIAMLEPVYDIAVTFITMAAVFLALLYPAVAFTFISGLTKKVRRFFKGGRPQTTREVMRELVHLIPYVVFAVGTFMLYSSLGWWY